MDAWPPELVFFTRVTAMLRGLCSSLEVRHPYPHPYPKFSPNPNPNHNPNPSPKPNQVRHPYLSTMVDAARVTLREAVPQADHATSPVQPTPQGLESSPLQARLEQVAASLVGRGEAVGLQVAVRQRGKVLADVAAGTLGTADPRPVRRSSLFNVFRLGLVLG